MNTKLYSSGGRMTYVRYFVCTMTLALLSACGSKSEDPAPAAPAANAPAPAAAAPKPAPVPAVVDPTEKMPRAVGNGKPGAAVDIKYDFAARPEAGKPVELQVVFIPKAGVDALQVTFGGMDGITLAGDLTASVNAPKAGEPYKHTLSVLAGGNGVYYISANVSTQISGVTLGRTFAIPFVVGSASAAQKPQTPPATDATGKPVEPMKAQETTSK